MRYMLMMHAPRGTGDWQVNAWSHETLSAHIHFMHKVNADLSASGELVDGQGLGSPGDARIVQAGKDGLPAVTDGPFAEAKEFLAGYWIVEVDSAERAYAIAGRVSTAPGPDGKPLNMRIEVRQVMSAPPTEG